jgi:hypothetical protein
LAPLCLVFAFFFAGLFPASAQTWDPSAGQPGSKAIAESDPEIKGWASRVISFERGYRNFANPGSGLVSAGVPDAALGPALKNGVFSLGDGGSIVLGFAVPVTDGPGPDFAVFENGFSDGFLELAQVEVSSNGLDFFPFPAYSETQTKQQTGPFDTLDARNLHNLAGKYRAGFGTGFDLNDLAGTPGLDIQSVRYIKVRDVIGSLDPAFCTRDALGRIINDPWPTDFESGGFDFDAVAILHFNPTFLPVLWPSLIRSGESISFMFGEDAAQLELFSTRGECILRFPSGNGQPIRLPEWLGPGVYFLVNRDKNQSLRILVQ